MGENGVMLLRDVLGRGITIENEERGERSKPAIAWWGGTFRLCLRHLAEVTGFAVRNAYENQRREDERQEKVRQRQETNRQVLKTAAGASREGREGVGQAIF